MPNPHCFPMCSESSHGISVHLYCEQSDMSSKIARFRQTSHLCRLFQEVSGQRRYSLLVPIFSLAHPLLTSAVVLFVSAGTLGTLVEMLSLRAMRSLTMRRKNFLMTPRISAPLRMLHTPLLLLLLTR